MEKTVKTDSIVLFKEGMSTWFDQAEGKATPVTVLRFEPHVVTRVIQTPNQKSRIQVAVGQKNSKKLLKPISGLLEKVGLARAPKLFKELLVLEDVDVQQGDRIGLGTWSEGAIISVVGTSKGKGFAGSVKRFGFGGGPASHGSKFHRQPGSSGNRTWPGRIMPGKKFPGHLGAKTVHVKNLKIVKVDKDLGVVIVKGSVPGARNQPLLVLRGE
jgi:large subunit ribosomal protein L3